MRVFNNKGVTFVEIISSTLILLFIFQLIFNLIIFQKNFSEKNYLNGEYRRQVHFAESYLKRDFYGSISARKQGSGNLELTNFKGEIITYYLAKDPYGEESWKSKSGKTLYRKVTGENAQPLTQYCNSFNLEEILLGERVKVIAELRGGGKMIIVEEYYEK